MSDIAIRIVAMELLSKNLTPRPNKSFEGVIFEFDLTYETKVNGEKKVFISLINTNIRVQNDETVYGSVSFLLGFEIVGFDEVVRFDEEKKVYVMPDEVELTLRSVCLSTMRGVAFSEFRGTYLNSAVMPLIPLSSFNLAHIPQEDVPPGAGKISG